MKAFWYCNFPVLDLILTPISCTLLSYLFDEQIVGTLGLMYKFMTNELTTAYFVFSVDITRISPMNYEMNLTKVVEVF